MKISEYRPYPSFILRTPVFPLGSEPGNSDVFREAIYLASPELYEGNKSNITKKQVKFENSVLKYRNRATTRCTPFGLFAGCSVGKLGEKTEILLSSVSEHTRSTRLDMQYLCALIQHIEGIPDIRKQLLFYPNDSLYEIGGKYRYVDYIYRKTQRHHHVTSAEIDEALSNILRRAAHGATIDQLAGPLVDEINSYEDASNYVNELIDSQILKSELDPSVVGDDVLTTLIDCLSHLQDAAILEPLRQIQNLLQKIDSAPIGSTIPIYDEIIAIIQMIGVGYEAKYLFQTDMFKPAEKAEADARIPQQINKVIAFLGKITQPWHNQELTRFTETFQNRYEEEELPLVQVLDNELGIGYPAKTSEGGVNILVDELVIPRRASATSEVYFSSSDRVLLRKFIECTRNNEKEICLSDDDFKEVDFTHNLPDTLSVMCSLVGDEKIHVRSIGGASGANLLGRFCHLDPSILTLVEEVVKTEAELRPDVILAEIAHLPESRIGNIASRPRFREYTLHYLSNFVKDERDIPVSDLMISVRNGRLRLRSRKYDKEVVPRLTCAHNYGLSPIPVYRFLCDLQNQGVTPGLHCSWNQLLLEQPYLPRITYGPIILCRQRWILTSEDVAGYDKLPDEELIAAASSLTDRKRIPRFVVIPDSDNELFVDLQDVKSLQLMAALISQRKKLVMEEFLFDAKNAVVRQDGAPLTNELIFIFHK